MISEDRAELAEGVVFDIKRLNTKSWIPFVDFRGKSYSEIINHETMLEMFMNINDVKDDITKLAENKRKCILFMDNDSLIVRNISKDLFRSMRKS